MFSCNTNISEHSFYALKAIHSRVPGQPWGGASVLKHVMGRLRYLQDEGLVEHVYTAKPNGDTDETRTGYFLTEDGQYMYRRTLKRLRKAVADDCPIPAPVPVRGKRINK